MSLIHNNPWLIKQLLQSVMDDSKSLSKKGQDNSNQQVIDSLKALLSNILKESPEQISHATGAADLSSHNMDSMGDLIEWLSKHGTKIGSNVIAYSGNVNRPGENYGYYKIEPGTEIMVPLSKPDKSVSTYWINTEALKQYLISLQSDPKLKKNVIFQVQLLKLIQDANKQLDTDISETYKEPEKVIPDTTVLDNLPKDLSPQAWYGSGNIPLTTADLGSDVAFNAWLNKNSISIKSENQQTTTTINDPKFDRCAVLRILVSRAKYNLERATTVEIQQHAKIYDQRIRALAQQINCNLGQMEQTNQTQMGNISPRALQQLSTLRPFNSQHINFGEIELFLDNYAKLANKPEINNLVNQVKTSIQKANSILQSPNAPIQMDNFTTAKIKLETKRPLPLLNMLYTIISVSGKVYLDFYTEFKNALGEAAARGVEQQITSGGPQQTNINTIISARSTLMNEIQRGDK